jgi:hypothetical protein
VTGVCHVALLGSYRARVHSGWLMVDYRRAVHEPQAGPMVNRVHFPHSLSWFTVDRAHRAATSLFSSPWALLRAWRRSRRACGGRGLRREGGILPHFLHGKMRTPTVAIPGPSLSRKVVGILRNGRATAAPWPWHLR